MLSSCLTALQYLSSGCDACLPHSFSAFHWLAQQVLFTEQKPLDENEADKRGASLSLFLCLNMTHLLFHLNCLLKQSNNRPSGKMLLDTQSIIS